jgi:hypothetical protein
VDAVDCAQPVDVLISILSDGASSILASRTLTDYEDLY